MSKERPEALRPARRHLVEFPTLRLARFERRTFRSRSGEEGDLFDFEADLIDMLSHSCDAHKIHILI